MKTDAQKEYAAAKGVAGLVIWVLLFVLAAVIIKLATK